MNKTNINIFMLIMLISGTVSAQTCGFGCLGLSGAYGGITYQDYKPDGLNEHLFKTINRESFNVSEETFNETFGYRVGINVFQARFDNFFFSYDLFYQYLTEEKTLANSDPNFFEEHELKLRFDYIGTSVDIGIPLSRSFDWKILEGGVTYHRIVYEQNIFTNNELTSEKRYENEDLNLGYFLGSGLIIHLVKDYISLEGTIAYNFVEVENLEDEDGNKLINHKEITHFIQNAGLSSTVQLNVSFPL